jgi:hypothetical protein
MRATWLVLGLVATSCLPEKDLEGVACEPTSGCPAPYTCVAAHCTLGGDDAGSVDAGTEDAGTPDAGSVDAGSVDAGAPDAGSDAGTDAGRVVNTPSGSSGGQLHFVDVTGEGRVDALYADATSNVVSLWVQDPSGGLLGAAVDITTSVDGGIRELVVLQPGAMPKILVLPVDRSDPVLLEGVAPSIFMQTSFKPFTERVVAADVVDLDGDGLADQVFGLESATNGVSWRRSLDGGGAGGLTSLQTYATSTRIEGLRHAPVDGGVLVVDFGNIGFRSRVVNGMGVSIYSANLSGDLRLLRRVDSTEPTRLFLGQSTGGTLLHYDARPGTVTSDEVLLSSSFLNQRVTVDAGDAIDLCMGDFRPNSTGDVPSLLVASPSEVVAYPYDRWLDGGSFPGDRWAPTPISVHRGPVAGVGLASTSGGRVDLFVVTPGTPRTLVRINGN